MGSVTCAAMRRLEGKAFRKGSTAEALMEKAGAGIARAVLRRYPGRGTAVACIGSGNNGGDALVALRYLAAEGWRVGVKCLHSVCRLGVLPRKKWRELDSCGWDESLLSGGAPLILLDGLLGIGAKGGLRAPLDELAGWMNFVRSRRGADVVAVDIPTGLDGDTGNACEGAVVADLTLTVGVPKTGLLTPEAASFTGAVELVPLEELPVPDGGDLRLGDVCGLSGILRKRPHDFHKGDAGRVGILAGSRGMLGAAVLCATGAMRSGAGLVTLFAKQDVYELLALMCPPEVMVRPIDSLDEILELPLDALAVGPGIGSGDDVVDVAFFSLLEKAKCPLVVDADGLNRVAVNDLGCHLRSGMVLTPHSGEMARLFPEGGGLGRVQAAREFADRFPGVTLLLKGARSLVAEAGRTISVNGSGHAGMAAGGQGDVLTGVVASLLAQGVEGYDAARAGAWLCGRAAELAVSHGGESMRSLCASDVPVWLGRTFRELV